MFSRDCALILHSFQSFCSWLAEKRKWFVCFSVPVRVCHFRLERQGWPSLLTSARSFSTPILSHSPGGNKQMLIVVPGHTRSATILPIMKATNKATPRKLALSRSGSVAYSRTFDYYTKFGRQSYIVIFKITRLGPKQVQSCSMW